MSTGLFVIHLLRAEARKPVVDALLGVEGFDSSVVEAVDGRVLSDAELSSCYTTTSLFRPEYPFRLGRGEVACFLSHRKVWSKLVESGLDFGVVLEDDVSVDPSVLARAVVAARMTATLDDYVSLQTRPVPRGRAVGVHGQCNLIEVVPPPLRTSGQIVGRRAAERLLEVTAQFDRPVDVLLQMTWATGVRVLCADPSGISDWPGLSGASTAQTRNQRTFLGSLKRETLRAAYRFRIASISRSRNK